MERMCKQPRNSHEAHEKNVQTATKLTENALERMCKQPRNSHETHKKFMKRMCKQPRNSHETHEKNVQTTTKLTRNSQETHEKNVQTATKLTENSLKRKECANNRRPPAKRLALQLTLQDLTLQDIRQQPLFEQRRKNIQATGRARLACVVCVDSLPCLWCRAGRVFSFIS